MKAKGMKGRYTGVLLLGALWVGAGQATVFCDAVDPGGQITVAGVKYLVVGVLDGDHRYDIHNPDIISAIVKDGLRVCTSHVNNLDGLFQPQADWPAYYDPDIRDWDVRQVTSMQGTFRGAVNFNQNIQAWQTQQVTNMNALFYGANQFNQDLSHWSVGSVQTHQDFATDSALAAHPEHLPQFNRPDGVITARKTHALPTTSVMNETVPFSYIFTNTSVDVDAQEVEFVEDWLSLIREGVALDYARSSCLYTSHLSVGEHCTWMGTFTPQAIGQQLDLDIELHFRDGMPVSLHDHSAVIALAVQADIPTPFPPHMEVGQTYPFELKFSNPFAHDFSQIIFENHFLAREGVAIDWISSSCFQLSYLAAGEHCLWRGNFTPKGEGNVQISSTMHYQQGHASTLRLQPVYQRPATRAINDMPGDGWGWLWPMQRFQPYRPASGESCPYVLQDKLTGLLWARRANESFGSHAQAQSEVSHLSLCGLKQGWQLPDVHQLSSLVNYDPQDAFRPADWLNQVAQGFQSVQYSLYWTAQQGSQSLQHWAVDMATGALRLRGGDARLLAVHAPLDSDLVYKGAVLPAISPGGLGAKRWPNPRFVPAHFADGRPCAEALLDQLNGVMWAKAALTPANHFEAQQMAEQQTLCGYQDWGLPSLHELRSLLNFNADSANEWLQAQGFDKMEDDLYWSDRLDEDQHAWAVSFDRHAQVQSEAITQTHVSLPVRHLNPPLVQTLYANAGAFVAQQAGGQLRTWGHRDFGGDSRAIETQLQQVYRVIASRDSFAALKRDGTVISWGALSGVQPPARLQQVVQLASTAYGAFAALTVDGQVHSWGEADFGGDMSAISAEENQRIVQLFANHYAFAALTREGQVRVWGQPLYGGDQTAVGAATQGETIQAIYANHHAFAALTEQGAVRSWGKAEDGGHLPEAIAGALSQGIVSLSASDQAFAALSQAGAVQAWGDAGYGGDTGSHQTALSSGVVQLIANPHAFVALKADGSLISWGDAQQGGDSQAIASQLTEIQTVLPWRHGFIAINADQQSFAWGQEASAVNLALASAGPIAQLVSNAAAGAVLDQSGAVVVWGDAASGGSLTAEQAQALSSHVVQLQASEHAFAALKDNGQVISWGKPEYGGDSRALHFLQLPINLDFQDSDGDGLSDRTEQQSCLAAFSPGQRQIPCLNAGNPDSDQDGVPDGFEWLWGNPYHVDGDLLTANGQLQASANGLDGKQDRNQDHWPDGWWPIPRPASRQMPATAPASSNASCGVLEYSAPHPWHLP